MSAHDNRRFQAFADFIHKTYSHARKVADIGGGHGHLSYHLRDLGYDATIIDRRDMHLPRKLRRALRKLSVKQERLVEIPRMVCDVQDADLQAFDVLVALHPDEATEHTIRAAIDLDKELAIVPCCVFPMDGVKRSEENWREYLTSLSEDIQTATLPIRGANVVLYRRAAPGFCIT